MGGRGSAGESVGRGARVACSGSGAAAAAPRRLPKHSSLLLHTPPPCHPHRWLSPLWTARRTRHMHTAYGCKISPPFTNSLLLLHTPSGHPHRSHSPKLWTAKRTRHMHTECRCGLHTFTPPPAPFPWSPPQVAFPNIVDSKEDEAYFHGMQMQCLPALHTIISLLLHISPPLVRWLSPTLWIAKKTRHMHTACRCGASPHFNGSLRLRARHCSARGRVRSRSAGRRIRKANRHLTAAHGTLQATGISGAAAWGRTAWRDLGRDRDLDLAPPGAEPPQTTPADRAAGF